MNGISTFCYKVNEQESTESLREDLNDKYYVSMIKIDIIWVISFVFINNNNDAWL